MQPPGEGDATDEAGKVDWVRPALALLASALLLYAIGRLALAGLSGRADVEPDRAVWLGLLGFWLLIVAAVGKRLRRRPDESAVDPGQAIRDKADRAVTAILILFFLGMLLFMFLD